MNKFLVWTSRCIIHCIKLYFILLYKERNRLMLYSSLCLLKEREKKLHFNFVESTVIQKE